MHNIILGAALLLITACTPVSVDTKFKEKSEVKTQPDQSQLSRPIFPWSQDFLAKLRFAGSVEIEVFKIVDAQFKQTQKIPSQLMILSQLLEPKSKDIFYDCKKIHWIEKSDTEIEIQRNCEKQARTIAQFKKISINEYQISFIQNEWRTVIGDAALLNQKDKICHMTVSDHKVHELVCEDTLITIGTQNALEEIRIKKYVFNRSDKNQIVLTGGRYKDYLERSKINITVPDEGKIKFNEIEMAIKDDFAKEIPNETKKEEKGR